MASYLLQAGIERADGFSLNVSNFVTTRSNIIYGIRISRRVGGKHFVIDTSRNGLGSNGEWCNPEGRAIGAWPTLSTGHELVDAFLWIKVPGESDGKCNGGPKAGEWWADYALGLVRRAPSHAFALASSHRKKTFGAGSICQK
jgi:endoglucanase